jgi:hypothetical protein
MVSIIRNVGSVALVIVLGLVIGVLGLVAADLYAVGVLILFLGGVGAAVLAGEYLIWYFSTRRPPALRLIFSPSMLAVGGPARAPRGACPGISPACLDFSRCLLARLGHLRRIHRGVILNNLPVR